MELLNNRLRHRITKSDIIKALTEIASNNRIQFSLPKLQIQEIRNQLDPNTFYCMFITHDSHAAKAYSIIDPLSAKPTSKYGIDNHTILKKITLPELYILITEYPKAEDMGNIREMVIDESINKHK